MSDLKNISYDEFMDIYNSNPPNNLIKKTYNLFSVNAEHSQFKPIEIYYYFILFLFFSGIFGVICDFPKELIWIFTLTYLTYLIIFVTYLLVIIIWNDFRIRKIMNLLKINKREYKILANKYFNLVDE